MAKESVKQIDVFETLHQAVMDRVLLEIQFPGEEKKYGARLLSLSEDMEQAKKQAADAILSQYAARIQQSSGDKLDAQEDERWILITPLEPTDGNMRIRKFPKVILGFYRGLEHFQTVVQFRKVQRVEMGQAIELSWPAAFRSSAIREQLRVEIPAEMDLSVEVQKRGCDPFVAKVMDISAGGLSFASDVLPNTLQTGDKVGISIRGEILMGTPIVTFGSITFISKARDQNDIQVTKQLYGVQFKLLSVADAMTVDKLVRAVQPDDGKSTRKKRF